MGGGKRGGGKEGDGGGDEGVHTHRMSNHGTTHGSDRQAPGSSGQHSSFPVLLFFLLDGCFVPAAVGVGDDLLCFLAVVSARCAAGVVARGAHRSACWRERAVRSPRRGVGALRSLRELPLGAAGGLVEVVVALAILVPLGDPAWWQGRAAGGGCMRGRRGAVSLRLTVLRLLTVRWLVVVLGLLAVGCLLVMEALVLGGCGG